MYIARFLKLPLHVRSWSRRCEERECQYENEELAVALAWDAETIPHRWCCGWSRGVRRSLWVVLSLLSPIVTRDSLTLTSSPLCTSSSSNPSWAHPTTHPSFTHLLCLFREFQDAPKLVKTQNTQIPTRWKYVSDDRVEFPPCLNPPCRWWLSTQSSKSKLGYVHFAFWAFTQLALFRFSRGF